jgi:hypothetical protein
MPPAKARQPDPACRAAFLGEMERLLEAGLRSHAFPPWTAVRRINRFQDANAVKDLLDLRVVLFVLPEAILRDRSGYFDPASGLMPDSVEVGNRILGKNRAAQARSEPAKNASSTARR